MRTIYCRSPFLLNVNETTQVAGKLELFIWRKDQTEPTIPTITLSKNIPSTTQKVCVWDISPYIKANINFSVIQPDDPDYAYEVYDNWCYVRVKRYYKPSAGSFTLIDNTLYNSVYGYTDYMQSTNAIPYGAASFTFGNDIIRCLYNTSVKQTLGDSSYGVGQISFLIDYNSSNTYDIKYFGNGSILQEFYLNSPNGSIITGSSASYYIKAPLPYTSGQNITYDIQLWKNGSLWQTIGKYQAIAACKYQDSCINYINRYGGVETITFIGKKTDTLEVKRTEYNLMQDLITSGPNTYYNTSLGQSKSFNVNGSKTFKLNTGWVTENFSNKMQDLLLTETSLFYNQYNLLQQGNAIQVKTNTLKYQTHLNDKAINYEIDIDLAYNTINNVG
jgi:hypothetical protein